MSLPARLRAFGISKALDYLERDPDANLPKLMDWLDKYTGERLASPYRELFHRAMSDPGNNWHRLIKSMYTDIDSRVLKKIFENFVIHAGLMDWPSRKRGGGTGERPRPLGGDQSTPPFPARWAAAAAARPSTACGPIWSSTAWTRRLRPGRGGAVISLSSAVATLWPGSRRPLPCATSTPTACSPLSRRPGSSPASCARICCGCATSFPAIQVDEDGADATRAHGPLLRAVQAALRRGLPLHSGERRAGGHRTLL